MAIFWIIARGKKFSHKQDEKEILGNTFLAVELIFFQRKTTKSRPDDAFWMASVNISMLI